MEFPRNKPQRSRFKRYELATNTLVDIMTLDIQPFDVTLITIMVPGMADVGMPLVDSTGVSN